MTDETIAAADPLTAPLTKWQAFLERWAFVRAKLAFWWAGVPINLDLLKTIGTWAVLVLVAGVCLWVLASYSLKIGEEARANTTAAATAQKTSAQAAAIAALQADVDYLLTLAAAQQQAPTAAAGRVYRSAPQPRATARPMPAPQPMPQAAPAGATAWGATDLDRAIAEFDPATATPKTTTNGAQP